MRDDPSSLTATEPPSTPPPPLAPIDRVLVWIAAGLVLAGTFLGISRHGRPVAPRARELFVPAGVILSVIAWRSRRRAPVATIWLGLVALAMIGVGAHEAASGPWTLLAVPGTVAGCLACLRSAVRGPGDPWFDRMRWARRAGVRRTPPEPEDDPRVAGLLRGAARVGHGAGRGRGAASPGPSVDVQVVPVAYAADPALRTDPTVFGVAVRQAHCAGGATAYTVDVRGQSFTLSCASTRAHGLTR